MVSFFRSTLTWILTGCVLVIVVSVLGEFFIEVARDKGWYLDAGIRWDESVLFIRRIVMSPEFLYPISSLFGLVLGMWVPRFLELGDVEKSSYSRSFKGMFPAKLVFVFDPQSGQPKRVQNYGVARFYVAIGQRKWVFIAFERDTGTENVSVYANDGAQINYEIKDKGPRSLVIEILSEFNSSGLTIECEDPRDTSRISGRN